MRNLLTSLILLSASVSMAQMGTDSTRKISISSEEKSPTGAMWRSAVLPGWGQVYNESYWKAPIVVGIFVGLGIAVEWNHDKYVTSREAYKNALTLTNQTLSPEIYRLQREFYRDQRDRLIFYMGLTYLLTIADAYVDAHLFGFDAQGPLGLSIENDQQTQWMTLSISF